MLHLSRNVKIYSPDQSFEELRQSEARWPFWDTLYLFQYRLTKNT